MLSSITKANIPFPLHWRRSGLSTCTSEELHQDLENLDITPHDTGVDRVMRILGLLNPVHGLFRPVSPKEQLSLLDPILGSNDLKSIARVVAAFGALLNVFQSFVPTMKNRRIGERMVHDFYRMFPVLIYLESIDKMESNLKEGLNGLMALGTGKVSDAACIRIFPGRLNRLLRTKAAHMLHFDNSSQLKAAMFLRSLFESKRLWTEMSDVLKLKSMETHKRCFTRIDSIDDDVVDYIKLAVNLIVPPGTRFCPGVCVPTFSSCVENTYEAGGNHTFVGERYGDKCKGDAGLWEESYEERNGNLNYYGGDLVNLTFTDHSRKLAENCEDDFGKIDNRIEFMALQEAGKFRIITKGPSVLYTGFRPFQQFMLEQWKNSRFSTMKDQGKTDEKILRLGKYFESMERRGKDPLYCSGDYDKATDLMKREATLACLVAVLDNLNITDTPLGYHLLRSFSETTVSYPAMGDIGAEDISATNGQPMGHPCSFPLLCIINLAMYLKTIEWQPGPCVRKSLSGVLINGDDILFVGEEKDVDVWRFCAGEVGLMVNESKTYTSRRYAVINSRFFDMIRGKLIPYACFSLAFGHNVKKKGESEGLEYLRDVWCKVNESPILCVKALRRIFISTYQKLLKKLKIPECEYPNLFIPKQLGGVGCKIIEGFTYKISSFQRKIATYFIRRPKERYVREKTEVDRVSCKEAVKLAMRLMPDPVPFLLGKDPLFGPLNEFQDYESLFDETLSRCVGKFAYVMGKEENKERFRVLRFSGRVKKEVKFECPMTSQTIRKFEAALSCVA